jgi:hypothetical protein
LPKVTQERSLLLADAVVVAAVALPSIDEKRDPLPKAI